MSKQKPEDEICQHCGQDLGYHHWRNLKCPDRETTYLSIERKRREEERERKLKADASADFAAEVYYGSMEP
jgi:hypothetical protein